MNFCHWQWCSYLGEGGSSVVEKTRVHVVLVNEEPGANEVSHLLPQRRESHDAGTPHTSIAPKVRAHIGHAHVASSSASRLAGAHGGAYGPTASATHHSDLQAQS